MFANVLFPLNLKESMGNIHSLARSLKSFDTQRLILLTVLSSDLSGKQAVHAQKKLSAIKEELEEYGVENGVYVLETELYKKSYNQGLRRGIIITEVDREEINSVSDFEEMVEGKEGEAVLIKVVDRNGTSRFVGLEVPETEE